MPTRRHVLVGAAAAAGAAAGGVVERALGAPRRPKRPNIVWFRSEDNHASFVGAWGDPLAHTPTIDRLARSGVRYQNYFSTSPVCAPSKLAVLTGLYETSLGPGHHMRANATVPGFVNGFATYLQRAGYWCTELGSPQANPDHNTALTRTGYDDASGDWGNRPTASTPFFALIGANTTHETNAFLPVRGATDPNAVRLPAYHPDDPLLRLDRAHYMDQVTKMDSELGDLLDKLRADKLLKNTIVIYSSDHGGVMPRSKRYCYDSGLHAPLVVWFPKRWRHLRPGKRGSVYRAPASSVDMPATILGLAGVRVPKYLAGQAFAGPHLRRRKYAFSGRNRMDEQIDFVRSARDKRYRYIRNYMPHLTYAQHHQFMWLQAGVRQWESLHLQGQLNELQSRFWRSKPAEELYDLRADPDEVHNLAKDPRHRARLRRMSRALDDHLLATNDNGFIPEGMAAEGYDASRRPGAFPIRRVMALAALTIKRRSRHLPAFRRALGDRNEVVRWWGAMGCSQLGIGAQPAAALLERVATADTSPWVRAQAADALSRLGRDDLAVPLLGSLVSNTSMKEPVRLHAVWSLCRAGAAATPALPALTLAAGSGGNVGNAALYAVRVVSGTYTPAP